MKTFSNFINENKIKKGTKIEVTYPSNFDHDESSMDSTLVGVGHYEGDFKWLKAKGNVGVYISNKSVDMAKYDKIAKREKLKIEIID